MSARVVRYCSAIAFAALIFLTGCTVQYKKSVMGSGWTSVNIQCPSRMNADAKAKLIVLDYWMEHNALYVNLRIENIGNTNIIVPTRNTEIKNYYAELLDSNGEPVSFCGGVRILDESDFRLDLPSSDDYHLLNPGNSIELKSVYVAPFWPYMRDEEYNLQSFRVYYSFYEPEMKIPDSQKGSYLPVLKSVRKEYCQILQGNLESDVVQLDMGRYTPGE